jgi:hypothetical protein
LKASGFFKIRRGEVKMDLMPQAPVFQRMKQGCKVDTTSIAEIVLAVDGTTVAFPILVGVEKFVVC